MKQKNEKTKKNRRKPEVVKAIERICDLADAFSEASPEKQEAALNALDEEFKNEKNGTSRDWKTLFADTF